MLNKYFKFVALSKLVSGGKFGIRPNNIPKVHREKFEDLENVFKTWMERWGLKEK